MQNIPRRNQLGNWFVLPSADVEPSSWSRLKVQRTLTYWFSAKKETCNHLIKNVHNLSKSHHSRKKLPLSRNIMMSWKKFRQITFRNWFYYCFKSCNFSWVLVIFLISVTIFLFLLSFFFYLAKANLI